MQKDSSWKTVPLNSPAQEQLMPPVSLPLFLQITITDHKILSRIRTSSLKNENWYERERGGGESNEQSVLLRNCLSDWGGKGAAKQTVALIVWAGEAALIVQMANADVVTGFDSGFRGSLLSLGLDPIPVGANWGVPPELWWVPFLVLGNASSPFDAWSSPKRRNCWTYYCDAQSYGKTDFVQFTFV